VPEGGKDGIGVEAAWQDSDGETAVTPPCRGGREAWQAA
jgi:hypothetical protein